MIMESPMEMKAMCLTFGELKPRDTFVTVGGHSLLQKIHPVKSKRTPGLQYVAQDHVSGVIVPMEDSTLVYIVVIGDWAKRTDLKDD
jgi:hypothetical protein